MPTVRAFDGLELAVHELAPAGAGDLPTVVFCHATGFHGQVWAPIARRLSGRYHCLAIDHRGHGDSPIGDEHGLDWELFAADVTAVVDELGLAPCYGVGHSKGGAALTLAEAQRPGTFVALWLFEPVILPSEFAVARETNPLAAGARRRREVFDSRDHAYDSYASKAPLDRLHPDALRAYVDHGFADTDDGAVQLKCRRDVEARVFELAMHQQIWPRLHEVHCPVTIAMGVPEDFGPAQSAPAVAERLPKGRLVRYDDLTHFGPLEAPDRIATDIAAFFAEAAPDPR